MGKKVSQNARAKVAGMTRRRKLAELNEKEEKILRDALKYLVFKHGHLLVPAGIREALEGGGRRWIITMHLRYPTGFGGEIGELLYHGAMSRESPPLLFDFGHPRDKWSSHMM